MELALHHVPTGITGGNAFRKNGGQAVEAGLRAVRVSFGNGTVGGVQGRRGDAIERVVQFGDPRTGGSAEPQGFARPGRASDKISRPALTFAPGWAAQPHDRQIAAVGGLPIARRLRRDRAPRRLRVLGGSNLSSGCPRNKEGLLAPGLKRTVTSGSNDLRSSRTRTARPGSA